MFVNNLFFYMNVNFVNLFLFKLMNECKHTLINRICLHTLHQIFYFFVLNHELGT